MIMDIPIIVIKVLMEQGKIMATELIMMIAQHIIQDRQIIMIQITMAGIIIIAQIQIKVIQVQDIK